MKMSEIWLENKIFQKTHIAKADMITKKPFSFYWVEQNLHFHRHPSQSLSQREHS